MTIEISVEDGAWNAIPNLEDLARRAVAAALPENADPEISLVFASDGEMAALNKQWRSKDGPTNVLSFPAAAAFPRGSGDIVLAHGVVAREATQQGKTIVHHTSHLIVHGVLHLLGYDHLKEAEAAAMEAREIAILQGLSIANPYET